jgi:hypothetical protein
MKTITVQYHYGVQTFLFHDAETAASAYAMVSEALREYRKFKNDSKECVEMTSGSGKTTIRLEHINSVSLADTDDPCQEEYSRAMGRLDGVAKQEATLAMVRPR